jgi:two-component system LytT family response regulator
MIRALIVDDEPLARQIVREFLSLDEDFEIVGECANGFEAVKAVTAHDPDVLFLDIRMPKLDGFEVLSLLDRSPIVVFVTAYDEYALVKQQVATRERAPVAPMASKLRAKPLQRIVVRDDDGGIEVVPVVRIDYVEADDDAILIATGGRKLRKQQTLGELATELDPDRFVRIHRSYLLNIERIARVELYAKDSRVAILRDGRRLPVSRAGYARLAKLL